MPNARRSLITLEHRGSHLRNGGHFKLCLGNTILFAVGFCTNVAVFPSVNNLNLFFLKFISWEEN